MLLRKRDELQFPQLFAHIRYRRQQGYWFSFLATLKTWNGFSLKN